MSRLTWSVTYCFALAFIGFCGLDCYAEKNSEIKPALIDAKLVQVADDFEQVEPGTMNPGKKWNVLKGEWRVQDGFLVGKELEADHHAAVICLNEKNTDSLIRFSFRLDGSAGFHLSLNHAKGHLFRVIVGENLVAVKTDKDKKDPTSKAVTLGQEKTLFEQGKWYTMQVEMRGEHVVVQADNGLSIKGNHESLAVDKPNYRFVTSGKALQLDDIQIGLVETSKGLR